MSKRATQSYAARKERGRPQLTISVSSELLEWLDAKCEALACNRSKLLELLAVKGGYRGPLT